MPLGANPIHGYHQRHPAAAAPAESAVSVPPPRVSEDGKFYWDGSRWVPYPNSETVTEGRSLDATAVLAVVFGGIAILLSLFVHLALGFFFGLVAAILSIIASRRIRSGKSTGNAVATIGGALGVVAMLMLYVISFFASTASL